MALGMLGSLIRYCRHSPFFDTPETRALFLERLESIRADWRGTGWRGIVARFAPKGMDNRSTMGPS
jgi:hypothetical protein